MFNTIKNFVNHIPLSIKIVASCIVFIAILIGFRNMVGEPSFPVLSNR